MAGDVLSGRYTLVRLLGQGGFGEVWEATDAGSGLSVAVKINLRDSARSRFGLEIDTLAGLSHPGIVQLLDEGLDPASGRRFFVMERVVGHPLTGHGVSLRALLTDFVGLLEVLAFTHARGIIHRDLKPANVLVTGSGIKVLDFGVARWRGAFRSDKRDGHLTGTIGTPAYMSPEQASGEAASVGPASDLYSVGIMLYEVLAGRRPFYGSWLELIAAHRRAPPPALPPLEGVSEQLHGHLSVLLSGLLEKDYTHRLQRASDALALLRPALDGLPEGGSIHPSAPRLGLDAETMDTSGSVESLPVGVEAPNSSERVVEGAWRLAFLRAPFIGREREIECLRARLKAVLDASARQGVCVHGPTGVGKRCLVEKLSREVHESGRLSVVHLRLGNRADLLVTLHDALSRYLRYPRLEEAPLRRRVDAELAMSESDAGELAAFLLRRPGESEEAFARWGDVLYRVLSAIARHPSARGLLVWIDSAHETTSERSAGWLDGLLTSPDLAGVPLLAIWSAEVGRSSELWASLALAQVPRGVQLKLARRLAPGLDEAGLVGVVDAADGNPRFLRELLWRWAEGLAPDGGLPTSLSAVYRERVEAFISSHSGSVAVREALCALALMGQGFTPRQASWALDEVGVTVGSLLAAGWFSRGDGREEELLFGQEGLKAALLEMVGAHSGGLSRRAVSWRMRGALRALCHSDWERGLRDLHDAERLLARTPAPEAGLEMALGDARARLRYRQRDRQGVLREATAFEGSAPALARLWRGAAALLENDYEGAEALFESALRGFVAGGDWQGQALALQYAAHGQLHRRDLVGARDRLEAALVRARSHRRQASGAYQRELAQLTEADITRDLAEVAASLGARPRALELLEEAMGLHEVTEDRQGQAYTCVQLTRVTRQMAELAPEGQEDALAGARVWMTKARGLMAALNDRRGHALLAWEGALISIVEGERDSADHLFEAAGHLFEAAGDDFSAALCLSGRAESAQGAGHLDEAIALYRRYVDRMERLHSPGAAAVGLLSIAWIQHAEESPNDAQETFTSALAALDAASQPQDVAAAHVGLAVILEGRSRREHLIHAKTLLAGDPLEDEPPREALRSLLDSSQTRPEAVVLIETLLGAG